MIFFNCVDIIQSRAWKSGALCSHFEYTHFLGTLKNYVVGFDSRKDFLRFSSSIKRKVYNEANYEGGDKPLTEMMNVSLNSLTRLLKEVYNNEAEAT